MHSQGVLTVVEHLERGGNEETEVRICPKIQFYENKRTNAECKPEAEGDRSCYQTQPSYVDTEENSSDISESIQQVTQSQLWLIFRLGVYGGMLLILFTAIIIAAVTTNEDIQWQPAFRMYRGLFLFSLEFLLYGINVFWWRRVGINHIHICDLHHRKHLGPYQIFEMALFFLSCWSISVVAFIFSDLAGIPRYAHPLALTSFLVLFGFNTLKMFQRHARFWLLKALWRVLTAPFHHVAFADFWLADQLNSLVVALLDMEYIVCYYALDFYSVQDRSRCGSKAYGIRPLVACLPAWWRFAQSMRRYNDTKQKFPHLANAGKYSTTFFVVFFSTAAATRREATGQAQTGFYFFFWIFSSFVSTCYTYTWDIKMDWGLVAKNNKGNTLLRSTLLYNSKGFYYFAMVSDLFLRLSWILTVSVGEAGLFHSELLTGMLAVCEVFRRFIWNFIRVENEHLSRSKKPVDRSVEELREYDEEESCEA